MGTEYLQENLAPAGLRLPTLRIRGCLGVRGLSNQIPQTEWLKTEICSLTVLEAGVQNQGVGRAVLPLKILGEEFFLASSWLLVVARNPWFSSVYRHIALISASCHAAFSLHVSVLSCLLQKTSVMGFRTHPNLL